MLYLTFTLQRYTQPQEDDAKVVIILQTAMVFAVFYLVF